MVGRHVEAARLTDALQQVQHGPPRFLIIGGKAGIGKSRLIDEFDAGLGEAAFVLRGQCVDLGEVAAPFAAVKVVLRSLIAEVGPDRVVETAGPGRAALAALLPELPVPGPAAPTPAGAASTAQLHEAVAVLLENLSHEKPVVVVLEDLHWIGDASLALLRFLMRGMSSGPVLFLFSFRAEDVGRGHPMRAFLSEAERSQVATRFELGRLTPAQVRKQMRAISGEPPSDAEVDTVPPRV